MTYKALTSLEWIVEHCNESKYIMKTDDDAFVNIFAVVQHLLDLADQMPAVKSQGQSVTWDTTCSP